MARPTSIGKQDFEKVITENNFYVDKTLFIKEWWENQDDVTLIARPRRFGKTLTLDMLEKFFSIKYAERGDLFERLAIWQLEEYRKLQGTYPVISLSFASIKENSFHNARRKICYLLTSLYSDNRFLLESGNLTPSESAFFERVSADMGDAEASLALHELSKYLCRYYEKKVVILLDEYDTPMQEAYVYGYWEEMVEFARSMFNSVFKTNPCLERAIMTGITRVTDIYNPWSIINFLAEQKFAPYWANTSSNSLIGKLIREGSRDVKMVMEDLLKGGKLHTYLDEQIVFSQLDTRESALWSLLLASGYLRVERFFPNEKRGKYAYDLVLTNLEVRMMFEQMIEDWFADFTPAYNDFIRALLRGDVKSMNAYMNKVALETISYFDTGRKPSEVTEPEKLPIGKATTKSLEEPNSSVCFYHGFVLGLIVDLADQYTVTSNRESGFGRYDVMLEPCHEEDDAIIMEFKVYDPEEDESMKDTVKSALTQIDDMQYAVALEAKGIAPERIRKYGFAFEGKKVLIG